MFGGYDRVNITVTRIVAETKNGSQFIHDLEDLLVKECLTGRVLLLMDNAAYYKSAPTLAALACISYSRFG
ncbi:MAG TPA: hypothetical protein VLA49_05025 [Anaerolineales bacterium]|nr:hypothetical protein [Anaerolineales bacterium]